jgi:hypothetical protein
MSQRPEAGKWVGSRGERRMLRQSKIRESSGLIEKYYISN